MSIDRESDGVRLDQFVGCLLGLAVGDAVAAPYEGLPEGVIHQMGPADALVREPRERVLRYTDDTQMAIGVAEVLADHDAIDLDALAATFAAHFDSNRGYGPGARRILGAVRDGGDWRTLAATIFPGGSLGNGAAMRVAPVGLLFCDDLDRVAAEAEQSALPTHTHPIGIDGARLLAVAVALATRPGPFDRRAFYRELAPFARTEEFQWQISIARQLRRHDAVSGFGNSLEAHRSVMTSIAIFAAAPDDYLAAIGRALGQGNDVDTLAAMTGALVGAHVGAAGLPPHLIDRLEDDHPRGRTHLERLAGRLHARHRDRHPDPAV